MKLPFGLGSEAPPDYNHNNTDECISPRTPPMHSPTEEEKPDKHDTFGLQDDVESRVGSPAGGERLTKEAHLSNATKRVIQHSKDGDEALKAFAGREHGPIEIDEATNRRLLWKIDMHIMPILLLVYTLNFLDKISISFAAVMGFQQDLGLHGDEYNWLSSIFYFGYLAFEYPTNYLMQRLPIGKYSAFNTVAWGIVLCSLAGVQNYGGALAVRFLLGLFESAVTPGFALITSQWYTKKEQAFRAGIWFSGNGFATIIGGLIAYAIAKGVDAHGSAIAPWKIIFLVTGLLTVVVGVVFYFVIPDNQLNARFLTKEERILALERIRVNQQGVGNKHWKAYQFKEAFTDPQVWMMFFYAITAQIPNGGITNFFTQLVVGFGFTKEESLLWTTPGGPVVIASLVVWGWMTYYIGNRILWSIPWLLLSIFGVALLVGLPLDAKHGRLAGYYFTLASATPFVALLSLISSNVAGYTKKTTVAALYLIAYCAGNIIGPQMFRPKDAPRYVPAEIAILVCWSVCLVDLVALYCYYRYQNSKKAKLRAQQGYIKLENQEFLDLTDKENLEFEYAV